MLPEGQDQSWAPTHTFQGADGVQAQLAKVLRAEIGDLVFGSNPQQLRSLAEWLHPPLKLELTFNFDVGDSYRQHPLVNIDSRWVVITR